VIPLGKKKILLDPISVTMLAFFSFSFFSLNVLFKYVTLGSFFLTSFFSFFLQVVDTKSLLPVSCLCVSYGCWISVPVLNINSEHVFLC
jgi:hypothetical protein